VTAAFHRVTLPRATPDTLSVRKMLLSTPSNETSTNLSAGGWDDLDSLWPDQTPFDVVWYGVLLIVLYSLVFTACVVGKNSVFVV